MPGCTARRVEVHHFVPRADGGTDDDENLLVLCPFHHHQGVHGNLANASRATPGVGVTAFSWAIGLDPMSEVFWSERGAEVRAESC